MSYTIEAHPDKGIIWEAWGADFNPETEAKAATQEEIRLLNVSRKPMVLVVDLRLASLSWDEIMYIANYEVPEEMTSHPHLRKIILITTDAVVAKAAEGMDNEAFGFIKFDIVTSSDEALAHARQFLA